MSRSQIGRIIREQRKKLSLSLSELSRTSGVSVSHLGRVESGDRQPSPRILQKIAQPLGFDLLELLIMAGYLSSEPSTLSDEQRKKLYAELNMLLERLVSDSKRIKEIVYRLLSTR